MGGQQNDSVLGEAVDVIPEPGPLPGVQARRGLVQDQQLRIAQQGLGQQYPLLHAAGEAADLLVAHIQKIGHGKHPVDFFCYGFPGDLLQPCHVDQEALGGHSLIKALLLGHVSQGPTVIGPQPSDIRAVKQDAAAVPFQIVGDQVHHGAFAGTVGTQDSVNSRPEGKGKSIQRHLFAVFLGQTIQDQFHRHLPLIPASKEVWASCPR